MEANIKENQLTFSKGMSNVPSDNLCEDNTLSDCVGLRMKDGELRAVQKPIKFGNIDGEILYVHKADYRHAIIRKNGMLYWEDTDEDTLVNGEKSIGLSVSGETQITSIGNVLIVSDNNGLKYAIWKDGDYKAITSLPELDISVVSCDDEMSFLPPDFKFGDQWRAAQIILKGENHDVGFDLGKQEEIDSSKEAASDEVIGLITGAYTNACSKGYFTFPFWVRVAIRMYDGSYAMISNPVLAFPTVRYGAFVNIEIENSGTTSTPKFILRTAKVSANYSTRMKVCIDVNGSFEGLEDVIDKVVIFMSDQVRTWEDDGKRTLTDERNIVYDKIDGSGSYIAVPNNTGKFGMRGRIGNGGGGAFGNRTKAKEAPTIESSEAKANELSDSDNAKDRTTNLVEVSRFFPPYNLTDDEIIKKLVNTSVFYKIAEVKPNSKVFSEYVSLDTLMERGVLENLTTQEQLPHDDYYGHCAYKAKFIYAFNNRLNITNIIREPYIGAYHFSSWENTNSMTATVRINGKDGYMYVTTAICCYKTNTQYTPCFFFYPDPNADYVAFSNGVCKKLSPHPRLNGAYFFDYLPPINSLSDSSVTMGSGGSETLNTTIRTSEVNNPWIFNADGENIVGTGTIIGVVANTKALSQGQFGQHPLIVFTTEGIYALGTNSEGLYNTNYPLSREVCNNSNSITPTDGAVFFTSEKGLMMMVGSDITCVSQQMMGKTDSYSPDSLYSDYSREKISFGDFLKNCIIAYDYKDYCLYLINKDYSYHYVYDIKSGAFTRNVSEADYQKVVNDYPDNLLQDKDNNVWTLIKKNNPNEDIHTYDGMLLSRPAKFGDAQTLKSLRQIKHVMDINDKATIELHIYVSNDLKHWGEVKSLRGSGWKYFRFGIKFSNLKATDSYSGMICITQNRRTDKLR